ncbi:MAG: hypothetical protein BGO98_16025 [Myxococcales bacterium 68-20]|nr:MAG: hypothetical protein BGO98_16025 [Myxococcales bacterium 68-20]
MLERFGALVDSVRRSSDGVGSCRLRPANGFAVARVVALALVAAGCSTASGAQPSRPVAAASPPKDDGKQAQGGTGGDSHSAALEQLKVAPITRKPDRQNAVHVPLPDAEHWTRVRFLTLKSLVGFRYGKDHHAIFAGFVTHVDDNSVQGACNKSFEQMAAPWVDAFEVELKHEPPVAFTWSAPQPPVPSGSAPPVKKISIVDVDPLRAKTATVLARESYEAAWAAYPAWGEKACLVLGVAIPARDDPQRARAVRDRFLQEVFPKVAVTSHEEPKERY